MSGNEPLFDQYVNVFKDMKKDYNTKQPPIRFCGTPKGAACDDSVDKYTTWIFPKTSTQQSDVVLDMLSKIQCLTPNGNGGQTRTHLVLSMHTMRGARGNYLASAIRDKWAQGCDFRVSYGLIGFKTKQILGASTARGRIPLRSTGLDYHPDDDFDLNMDGEDDVILDYYTHQKYLVIQGTYNGVPNTNMVLTGSSNWASLGTAEDEVFFTIQGREQRQALPGQLQLVLEQRPVLAQRLHDDVHRLQGRPDGTPGRRLVQEGLRHGAPPGDHGRARSLPRRRPVLGRRLIAPPCRAGEPTASTSLSAVVPASSAVSSSWARITTVSWSGPTTTAAVSESSLASAAVDVPL